MRKGDIVFALALIAIVGFMLSPWTSGIYQSANTASPYLMGFAKFAILATMGELLAARVINKAWKRSVGMVAKALLWGFYGMLIVLIMNVFASGVSSAMKNGYLPGGDSNFLFALFSSCLMNIFFAPVMMAMHKTTDAYVEARAKQGKVKLRDVIYSLDWKGFFDFTLMKMVPLFWIPAHTVSFLLPASARVAMAALLSMAFGVIATMAKRASAKAAAASK